MNKARIRIAIMLVVALLAVSGMAFGTPSATAQAVDDNASGAKLVVLGVAGGPPFQPKSVSTGFMLVVNGEQYLIDCGGGTPNNIMRAGYSYGAIHNIFFTHLHLDHYLGYTELIGRGPWAQDGSPLETITAYGPSGTEEMNANATAFYMQGALILNDPPIEPDAMDLDLELLDDGIYEVYYDENVSVKATLVNHALLPPHAGGFATYAYRFDIISGADEGKSIVFSGDRGPGAPADALFPGSPGTDEPDLFPELAEGADILVHEAMDMRIELPEVVKLTHTDVTLLPGLAKEWNVGTLVLNHFIPADSPRVFRRLANSNRNGFTGKIIVPRELTEIDFQRLGRHRGLACPQPIVSGRPFRFRE